MKKFLSIVGLMILLIPCLIGVGGCGKKPIEPKKYTAIEMFGRASGHLIYGSNDVPTITDSNNNVIAFEDIEYTETLELVLEELEFYNNYWTSAESGETFISGNSPVGTYYSYNYSTINNGYKLEYVMGNYDSWELQMIFENNYLRTTKIGQQGLRNINYTFELMATDNTFFIQFIDSSDQNNIKVYQYFYDKTISENLIKFGTSLYNQIEIINCNEFVSPQLEYTVTYPN